MASGSIEVINGSWHVAVDIEVRVTSPASSRKDRRRIQATADQVRDMTLMGLSGVLVEDTRLRLREMRKADADG